MEGAGIAPALAPARSLAVTAEAPNQLVLDLADSGLPGVPPAAWLSGRGSSVLGAAELQFPSDRGQRLPLQKAGTEQEVLKI